MPAQVIVTRAQVVGVPAQVVVEPAQIIGEPALTIGERAQVVGQRATLACQRALKSDFRMDFAFLLAFSRLHTHNQAMKRIIQVRITRGESHYVAECLDLPVVTQGKTLDELAENLEEAIALHLEGEDLSEFGLDPQPAVLASFELDPLAHAKT